MNSEHKHWLFSRGMDILILFMPVWLLWVFFFVFADQLEGLNFPLWMWVVFILGIDVSHVWSSLFRSYGDREEFRAQRKMLIFAPILAFAISLALLSYSHLLFWRIMAYLAVFHFIKQQYGFVALYKYRCGERRSQRIKDKWVIYLATIYPVIYWHFHAGARFNWFVENDFLPLHSLLGSATWIPLVFQVLNVVYWLFIAAWLFLELKARAGGAVVPTGKILWVLTTAFNWWFGIVYFNSDIVFSVSNVVAHGIPYLALIYYYRVRKQGISRQELPSLFFRLRWIFILLGTVLFAALVEEYFWDMLIYRERGSFFETVFPYHWQQLKDNVAVIIAIALLALPQQVHYVMDGFIWKMNGRNPYVKSVFGKHES